MIYEYFVYRNPRCYYKVVIYKNGAGELHLDVITRWTTQRHKGLNKTMDKVDRVWWRDYNVSWPVCTIGDELCSRLIMCALWALWRGLPSGFFTSDWATYKDVRHARNERRVTPRADLSLSR